MENNNANNQIVTLDQPHHSRSAKYQLVPTKAVAQKFYDLGFKLDEYKSVRVRDASRVGYQKHFVRLSHPTMLTSRHSDLKLQLLVTNSHDGSSAFTIALGIYRLVCSNGLVVGTEFEKISIRHQGNVLEQIEPAIERMVAQVQKLDEMLDRMKGITLTPAQIQKFYGEAIKLRFENKTVSDVIITSRRTADDANDLFTVYNRAQEALIRGTQVLGNNNRFRQRRAITNISKDVKINEKLFDLASTYAQELVAA